MDGLEDSSASQVWPGNYDCRNASSITGIAGQDETYLARGLLRRGYAVHSLLPFPFDCEEPVLRCRYPADSQPGGLEGE